MKKLLLVMFLSSPALAIAPIEVSATVPSGTLVIPSSSVSFNLQVRGLDSVSVNINSTNLGTIYYPYNVSFGSLSSGNNTLIVTGIDYRGQAFSSTILMPVISTNRLLPKRLFR